MTVSLKIFVGDSGVMRSLRVGSRLDKYRLTKRLGSGGFATVYSALDQIENRQVALKLPDERFVSDTASLEDLQREVRIMAKLEHPQIVQLKDARFIDGRFVMVFPLGLESLDSRLQRRLGRQTAVQLAEQMVAAVAFAHGNKVLHRDIKPDNFILFPDNQLRLTDFGLARIQRGKADHSASGTLGYMAPEQAMGRPTFRSDVFGLGLVLYRMFSGKLPAFPFEGALPGIARARRTLTPEYLAWILKAIEPSPSKRYRDAVTMLRALQRIKQPLKASGSAAKSAKSAKAPAGKRSAAASRGRLVA